MAERGRTKPRVVSPAPPEMVEGYRDGFADPRDELPENHNRSEVYQFGWRNGRDDRMGKPRASHDRLKAEYERITGEPFDA